MDRNQPEREKRNRVVVIFPLSFSILRASRATQEIRPQPGSKHEGELRRLLLLLTREAAFLHFTSWWNSEQVRNSNRNSMVTQNLFTVNVRFCFSADRSQRPWPIQT